MFGNTGMLFGVALAALLMEHGSQALLLQRRALHSRILRPDSRPYVSKLHASSVDPSDIPNYAIRDDEYNKKLMVRENGYLLYFMPFIAPFLGFLLFDPLAGAAHDAFLYLGAKNWAVVDGGQYKAEILAPAVNGIVVPTISITLATLVAGTISALRDRQSVIRECINKEACSLRAMHSTLMHMCRKATPQHSRNVLSLLYRYNTRIVAENNPVDDVNALCASDSELQTLLRYMYLMEGEVDATLVGSVITLLTDLNMHRSRRLTSLQSEFPTIHWAVISSLGISILSCFMIETDQDTLKFLDDTQLRILFAFLMGAVSSTALLCFDLSKPFKFGFFCISASVEQLLTIRNEIEKDLLSDMTRTRSPDFDQKILDKKESGLIFPEGVRTSSSSSPPK
ncbi:hypothetical protein B484DRAFT_266620 [Ochromonadaceae sp. CCMP2298]|nr:hypothetical protein B484DRAFT_266620 [Ochromonadaceae sp. CCMP2298]|mmetsp:Transcript_21234/g.47156  ORF Transcript_21234/g.47156 Transcript_21234/m.47156 type:complete len:397 (-) Transcript_21234:93-1283(-)